MSSHASFIQDNHAIDHDEDVLSLVDRVTTLKRKEIQGEFSLEKKSIMSTKNEITKDTFKAIDSQIYLTSPAPNDRSAKALPRHSSLAQAQLPKLNTPTHFRETLQMTPIRSQLNSHKPFHFSHRNNITPIPGTRTKTAAGSSAIETPCRVAIIENRGREVGLAVYKENCFDIELRQFCDQNSFPIALASMMIFSPIDEIIMSSSSQDGVLHMILERTSFVKNIKKIFVDRKFFNETEGLLRCEKLTIEKCQNIFNSIEYSKYLAISACNALIKYLEVVHNRTFIENTFRIRLKVYEGTLFLDLNTIQSLELIAGSRTGCDPQAKCTSFLALINKTRTKLGYRFLRRTLLEPPNDIPTIHLRQILVQEFLSKYEMYSETADILSRIPDLETIINQLVNQERWVISENSQQAPPSMQVINNVMMLQKSLENCRSLLPVISSSYNQIILSLCDNIRNSSLTSLSSLIRDVIDENVALTKTSEAQRLQNAFTIKPERSGFLDVARKLLSEIIEDINNIAVGLRNQYKMPSIAITYTVRRGYHLSCPVQLFASQKTPDSFIQIVRQGKLLKFSTNELVELNDRYQETLQEIWSLSSQELEQVTREFGNPDVISALYRLCDGIALLDCILSFVALVSDGEKKYCRPEITESGPIVIKQGRHPILDVLLPHYVPNDTFMSESKNFHIITGVNMAGKSSYIKGVALISIMAHIGSFVPCSFCCMRSLDKVATRIGANDSIEKNESSFSCEMSDMASIIKHLENLGTQSLSRGSRTKSSKAGREQTVLVVIDELARSTSYSDGVAIAYAISEYLVQAKGIFTLFATHHSILSRMKEHYSAVETYHMLASPLINPGDDTNGPGPPMERLSSTQLKYTFQLSCGKIDVEYYGLITARNAGLGESVIMRAERIRKQISGTWRENEIFRTDKDDELEEIDDEVKQNQALVCGFFEELVRAKRKSGSKKEELISRLRDIQTALYEVIENKE